MKNIFKMAVLVLIVSFSRVQARANLEVRSKCQGWRHVESDNGMALQHFHSHECQQTINITNNNEIYVLIPGPYGFDHFLLNACLPKKFPDYYVGKCCWLRKTKDGKRLVMTYLATDPDPLI